MDPESFVRYVFFNTHKISLGSYAAASLIDYYVMIICHMYWNIAVEGQEGQALVIGREICRAAYVSTRLRLWCSCHAGICVFAVHAPLLCIFVRFAGSLS